MDRFFLVATNRNYSLLLPKDKVLPSAELKKRDKLLGARGCSVSDHQRSAVLNRMALSFGVMHPALSGYGS
jgi:hypothetical protein